MEPLEHISHILHRCHEDRAKELDSRRDRLARLLLENRRHLVICQLISCQGNPLVLVCFWVQESFGPEESNIIRRHHLQRLPLQRHLEASRKNLAKEARNEILIKGSWSKNCPPHVGILASLDEVVLDVVLIDKVRDPR